MNVEKFDLFKESSGSTRKFFHFSYEPKTIFRADDKQWIFGREPLLRRMKDGSLVCFIYSGGKREPSPDNLVLVTRSVDDGNTWSPPKVAFSHSQRAVWSTELFIGGSRPMLFLYTFCFDTNYFEIKTFISYGDDSGENWTTPVSVPGGVANHIYRKGFVASDGTWIFPVYWAELRDGWEWNENERGVDNEGRTMPAANSCWTTRFACGMARSIDQGKSFSLHGYVHHPEYDRSFWEPNIAEIAPGKLAMFIRTGGGALWRSDSEDNGLTWSKSYPTDIPNPGTKLDITMIDGAIVMTSNFNSKKRDPLSIWVSKDGCETWSKKIELIRNKTDDFHNICYPHVYYDNEQRLFYIACDSIKEFFLLKVPYNDVLKDA